MRYTRTLLLSGWMIVSSFVPLAFAEREIHTENADGSISIVVERTAQEQARAENSYQHPTLGQVTYFDSYTGQPTSRDNFQKTYSMQLDMVRDSNNTIVAEAERAFKQGVISHDEFMKQHSIVQMANSGLQATRNQTVSTIQQSTPKPTNQTADGRTASKIIIQKPKVLVSG